jgi:restriction system protein
MSPSDLLLGGILKSLSQFWFVWLIFATVIIGKFVLLVIERKRLAKSGIADIDKMDGKTFEKYLEVMFERLGYKVERTRYVGDYGADLVTVKDAVKTVIQAKRHKSNVGVKAIQEAVAAKGYYDCEKAMVVTNSFYTNQAKELASKNQVELWDRKDVAKHLLKIKESGEEVVAIVSSVTRIDNNIADTCTICGVTVSEKVQQFCVEKKQRFGGKTYCFEHQKSIK